MLRPIKAHGEKVTGVSAIEAVVVTGWVAAGAPGRKY
jgi:hypothetical protein